MEKTSTALFSLKQVITFAIIGYGAHNIYHRYSANADMAELMKEVNEIRALNKHLELSIRIAGNNIFHANENNGADGKNTKFFHRDFETAFNVEHAQDLQIDPSVEKELRDWDLKQDEFYLMDPDGYDYNSELYSGYHPSSLNDRQIYVKWSGTEIGYGVFANMKLPANQYLGDYTGVLVNNSYNTDYMWTHPFYQIDKNGDRIRYGIDARHTGSMLRFTNHLSRDKINAEVIYFVRDGVWKVGYRTIKPVQKDEQIFVSYGENYWITRQMHDPTVDKD